MISLFLLVSSDSHKDSVEKEVHICLRKGSWTDEGHRIAAKARDVDIRRTCALGLNQGSAGASIRF